MYSREKIRQTVAGGNTAIIKCSSKSIESTRVLKELIESTFDREYICVIDGGYCFLFFDVIQCNYE